MKGFSLVEIMVTVAIAGIMAGSVVIGFESFGDTVRVRETAGVLTDTVKRLELETIRRDYSKNTVHFRDDFLLVDSEVENATLEIDWAYNIVGCINKVALVVDTTNPAEAVFLAQRDQYGNNIEIFSLGAGQLHEKCIQFGAADEVEWQYQIFKSGEVSNLMRFIHFNVRRDNQGVSRQGANEISLEIEAPYANKTFYVNGAQTNNTVEITLEDVDAESSETITLQE